MRYAIKVFSGREAEDMVSDDDLWRFTLTSYNAGPGCYRTALSAIYYRGFDLTWANLKKYLEPACRGSIPYVEFISKTAAYHPENDPALHPTATPDGTLVAPTETPVPVSLDVPHSDDELVVKISESNLEDALKVLESMNISRDKVSEPIDESGTRVIQVADAPRPVVLPPRLTARSVCGSEPGTGSLRAAEVIVPALETLVALRGTPDAPVRNLSFEGIAFAHATWLRPNEIGLMDLQANMTVGPEHLLFARANAARAGA